MTGKLSEEGGSASDTSNKKTDSDNNTVISRDTFSPDSVGNMNANPATKVTSTQGNSIVMT